MIRRTLDEYGESISSVSHVQHINRKVALRKKGGRIDTAHRLSSPRHPRQDRIDARRDDSREFAPEMREAWAELANEILEDQGDIEDVTLVPCKSIEQEDRPRCRTITISF